MDIIGYMVEVIICADCADKHTDGDPILASEAEYSYTCAECLRLYRFPSDGEPGGWKDSYDE